MMMMMVMMIMMEGESGEHKYIYKTDVLPELNIIH